MQCNIQLNNILTRGQKHAFNFLYFLCCNVEYCKPIIFCVPFKLAIFANGLKMLHLMAANIFFNNVYRIVHQIYMFLSKRKIKWPRKRAIHKNVNLNSRKI